MMFRLNRAWLRWKHGRAIRGIWRTPPLALRAGGVTLVSQLRREDLAAYLLAVKGFAAQVAVAGVHVIDDGSLRPADHARLRRHLPGLRIVPLDGIDTGACPRGGTWERLLHILDLCASAYVVQIDADILVTGALPEVTAAIAANRSFTLGSGPQFDVMTTGEAAAIVAQDPPASVQVAAEHALAALPPGIGERYVRGSSGFAGFASGAASRGQAEAFSRAMEARLGSRWREWGTEQVASNFLIASAPGGMRLPWPAYCCFYGGEPDPASVLFHFIGTWRFQDGVYARLGRRVVAELGG